MALRNTGVPLNRGQHPNSQANLKKGPQSRQKTRVRKLFSLAPETVEWLQQQPIPASQAIDRLVAMAKQDRIGHAGESES
jgi:hypothetical protein